MSVVVDGYTVYNAFPIKQRCWVHILRKAEKFAIRKDGNYMSCYLRLLAMYKGSRTESLQAAPNAWTYRGPYSRSRPRTRRQNARKGTTASSSRPRSSMPHRACSRSSGTPACPRTTTEPSWRYATPSCCTGTRATSSPSRRAGRYSRC